MLPKSPRLSNPPYFQKGLAARDPANTNAPGLQGNKNGPPGPGGNRKGPPSDATITEELVSLTSQTTPLETVVLSSDNSPSPPAKSTDPPAAIPALITTSSTISPTPPPSSIIVTSAPTTSPPVPTTPSVPSLPRISTSSQPVSFAPGTLTTSSVPAASGTVPAPLMSVAPSVESLTAPDVSASGDESSPSPKYSVSGSPSSTLSTTLFPVETTLRTTLAYTSSATVIQTWMTSCAWNSTDQSEYSAALPGQKAGIAVGGIGMVLISI